MIPLYLIDACGLFAFFQILHPRTNISKFIITDNLKQLYFKMLANQIHISIPIPALSELMHKMFKMQNMKEFKKIIHDFRTRKNLSFLPWDFDVLEGMSRYLAKNFNNANQYFKSKKKGLELFDLAIYQIALANNIKNVISKDEIFDELYKLNRFW